MHRAHGCAIVGHGQRAQFRPLLRPQIQGPALSLAVDPHVGDGVQPQAGRRVDGSKLLGVQAGEEVAFHVADGALHPAFSLGMMRAAGLDREAAMPGKIEVPGIEHHRPAAGMRQHGGLAVVHPHFAGHPVQRGEGMFMAGKELFLGLAERKLDVEHPRPGQDHREEAELAACVPDLHRTPRAPVHLGALARGKLQGQKRRPLRPHRADKFLEDAVAPVVAGFAQPHEELRRGVGMFFQQAHDRALVRVELALARRSLALLVALPLQPFVHRFRTQPQPPGNLPAGESLAIAGFLDRAIRLIVDHGRGPAHAGLSNPST